MTSYEVHTLQHIHYSTNENLPPKERIVIPTSVPQANMKAIDVTENTSEERKTILAYLNEYAVYLELSQKQVFSFENWIEHTKNESISLKWRTFKLDKTRKTDPQTIVAQLQR